MNQYDDLVRRLHEHHVTWPICQESADALEALQTGIVNLAQADKAALAHMTAERDILKAKLAALEGQEVAAWMRNDEMKVMCAGEKDAWLALGDGSVVEDYIIPLYLAAGAVQPDQPWPYSNPWAFAVDQAMIGVGLDCTASESDPDACVQTLINHCIDIGWASLEAEQYLAAGAAPASADRDAYEGAREDLLDWKRRALEAEACLRTAHMRLGEPI